MRLRDTRLSTLTGAEAQLQPFCPSGISSGSCAARTISRVQPAFLVDLMDLVEEHLQHHR